MILKRYCFGAIARCDCELKGDDNLVEFAMKIADEAI